MPEWIAWWFRDMSAPPEKAKTAREPNTVTLRLPTRRRVWLLIGLVVGLFVGLLLGGGIWRAAGSRGLVYNVWTGELK